MTFKDEIKRRIEIQQAWLNGEAIEYGSSCPGIGVDQWYPNQKPLFDWSNFDYRVKPKVYVKPEDLELGKTYLDETDGETMEVLEGKSDKGSFWCRTVQSNGDIEYVVRHGDGLFDSRFIEVQKDGQ